MISDWEMSSIKKLLDRGFIIYLSVDNYFYLRDKTDINEHRNRSSSNQYYFHSRIGYRMDLPNNEIICCDNNKIEFRSKIIDLKRYLNMSVFL